jgi:hypothetical protein
LITIGVDAHKAMNAALAVNDAGTEIGTWEGPNSQEGWASLARWASGLGEVRQWGIEGAWGYGRGLAQHLVSGGETVFEINARWTAQRRRSAHKPARRTSWMRTRSPCLSGRSRTSHASCPKTTPPSWNC